MKFKPRIKHKPLYIAVRPLGSKFARSLQRAIQEKVLNKIFRVPLDREQRLINQGRSFFCVTPQPFNKIEQLTSFKQNDVPHPPFVTDPQTLSQLGSKTIFARQLINSTNGRGIVEFQLQKDVPPPRAPLYTAYIPKKAEYRVHIFEGQVVDTQYKKKAKGFGGERDTRVRNMHNGYVYTRQNIEYPPDLHKLAINAVNALDYQYGAVDVIYNEKQNKLFVLEVNSRPGLMGTTLDSYSNTIINHFNLRRK